MFALIWNILSKLQIKSKSLQTLYKSKRTATMTTLFEWSSLIANVMEHTPPDVTFKIVDGDILGEVEGHKMVLGMVSLVFRRSFFSTETTDKTAKEIEVKLTTKPAFKIMIDAIYNRATIDASLKDKSVDEVFAVVNIVKRYEIKELVEAVSKYLSAFPLTDFTVLDVASDAIEYRDLYENEALELQIACAKYLKPKLKDSKAIFEYIAVNEDQKEVVAALLVLMNDINIAPTECSNCGQEPCQDGVGVKQNEFKVGLVVTDNIPATSGYWGNHSRGKGRVTALNVASVAVETIKAGPGGNHFGSGNVTNYNTTYQNVPNFKFCCK